MKIKTRLKLNTWFSLGLVILMLLSLGALYWEADQTDQNVLLVDEIEKAAFERIILRDDWLLNREDRARTQWYAKTETLRQLLASAARRFTSNEAKELLQDAQNDFEATASLFTTVLEKHKQDGITAQKKLDFTDAQARRISQVFLKAYSLNDNISRLHEHYRKAATAVRNRGTILIIIFIIGGIMVMVINSIALNKMVTMRVAGLHDGLAEISSGNLEHQIVVQGDDELADLARASNEMVDKLKQSYTSVENLQREISERKQAEESVQKLSLHQQALITAVPDIIMEVDENKIYTWANASGIDFFGEDVIGKSADFYFIREQKTYDIVAPIFNGNEDVIYVESWQKRRNGQERLLAWWCRVLKDTQGNVTGALSSAHDVTDRKLAEDNLRESEDKFKYMFDNATVGKSITLPDGKISVNKALSDMLGYSQDELNQLKWQDITHPEDVELTQREIHQMLSGEKISARFIKRYIHRNGSVVWTDLSSALRRDKDGKPLYLMSIIVDITEQRLAESQREAALEEIRKLNEELDLRVALRTAELTAKTAELERLNRVFVDRELRMIELKARIAELEGKMIAAINREAMTTIKKSP